MFALRRVLLTSTSSLLHRTFNSGRLIKRCCHNIPMEHSGNQFKHQTPEELGTTDFLISIPYGNIAVKSWGPENGIPVLAMHGWQDNAGTFDELIPLLSPSLYVVAFDAIGHGKSSHKPPGMFYHYMEMLVDIERVVQHLKWSQFSIIGHSMGGTLALMYASIYPERVPNVVLLDISKVTSRAPEALPDVTRRGLSELLNLESKMDAPTPIYSYEDAKTRLIEGMFDNISEESAKILLRRGLAKSACGKGYVFSRDIRVKAIESLQKLGHDDLKAYMRELRCNLQIIVAKNSPIFKSMTSGVAEEFLSIYKEVCKVFKFVEVEGNHFVHLNQAENVAPHINHFFTLCLNDREKL